MAENKKQLTLGSLFDGIAGFPLAAVRHGIKPVWGSEIEPDCVDITEKQFPDMQRLGDITKISGVEITPVDIISFGSPCQNLSVAGNRKGLAGEASQLFFEAVRIIDEMRCATNGQYPKYAIWENVAGAFSSNKGRDFQKVLEEITKTDIPMPASGRWAAAGMVRSWGGSTAWRTLDAQYWGVPQRRKRIYLVHSFGNGRAGQILFECESMFRDIAQGRAERKDSSTNSGRSIKKTDRMPAIFTIAGNVIGRTGKNGGNQLGVSRDISYTLTAADRHAVAVPKVLLYQDKIGSLCARDYKGVGNQYVGENKLIIQQKSENYKVRRLIPIEYERLQGFPDDWTKYGASGKEMSDNVRYKALGNSIAVPCAERVFRGILATGQEIKEDG